ncbi:MAG TPA: hypothetical protein VIJ15_09665 [Dermatophilaceae bacterium]
MAGTLVDTVNAQKAVIAEHIDAVYIGDRRAPNELVIPFESLTESATSNFVGRDLVFAAIEAFSHQHSSGYFEIIADAGLGKTAIAAEIARRREAVAFFASASRGLTRSEQFLTHTCAALITRYELGYPHVPVRAGEDSTFLERLLRQAVEARAGAALFVVVDALDEADEPSAGANPLLLPAEVPESVYFVVTRRPGRALITVPSTPREHYLIRRDDPEQHADITAYLERQVTTNPAVATVLVSAKPPILAAQFVAQMTNASEGNFMYLSYVLADMATAAPGGDPLDALPQGLAGYYEQFWTRIAATKEEGWKDWSELYRPTIEHLAVAAEAVTADWLAAHIGRPPEEIRERALQRWERVLSRERRSGHDTWRIIHRSFTDFLADEDKVNIRAAHVAVANKYDVEQRGDWPAWDDYGLRHTSTHLIEAAHRSAQPDRHVLVGRLVALLTDAGFQGAHLKRLRDPLLLERDLAAAVQAVAEDEAEGASLLIIEAALTLESFRRAQRRAAPIFELARQGDADAAARHLDMFLGEVERDWYNALLLVIAWLVPPRAREPARRLRDRVVAENPSDSTLRLLLQRFEASIGDAPRPTIELPLAPPQEEALARLERLGGAQGTSFLVSELQSELSVELRVRGAEQRGYLADEDGPLLVAAAVADPAFGEPVLQQYVAIHSAYGYREYRQGSLWALLGAVLRHPSDEWARTWAAAIGQAALAPNRGVYTEGLEFAALLAQAIAGDTAAFKQLEETKNRASSEMNALQHMSGRGAGDTWGIHKRRAGALAEVFSQLPDGHTQASSLLSSALGLGYGFAGFQVPACLTLAEAIEVAEGDLDRVDAALIAAQQSAHNIQDETFCARITGRVNAMQARWWNRSATPTPPAAVAKRLLRESSDAEFSALHIIGETYRFRDPNTTTPLSSTVRDARTLKQLAVAYQRPLTDVLRLNAATGWAADEQFETGAVVGIPDPGLPPLIAARLAGRALADRELSDEDRVSTIRTLVPVAASDSTTLHTVLARLLLAWRPHDPQSLARLANVPATPAEDPDAELAGHLTAYIP